jgi:hypothetical protein
VTAAGIGLPATLSRRSHPLQAQSGTSMARQILGYLKDGTFCGQPRGSR